MKKKCYTILLIGILFMSIPAFGQKTVVVVEPDEGLEIGALNNAIDGALDPGNTIFELRRGGLYLLNGSIAHVGYTLHIRAEAGEGPRPLLQPAVDNEGLSAIHCAAGGGLILESVYLYGLDELGVDIQTPVNIVGDPCKAVFTQLPGGIDVLGVYIQGSLEVCDRLLVLLLSQVVVTQEIRPLISSARAPTGSLI